MNTMLEDAKFLTWLMHDCGYRDCRPLGDGRWVAIQPLLFTHAIIIGKMHDRVGIEDRWCYHTFKSARAALDEWNGQGEPEGWHRHPLSGRRRVYGEEYIAP